MLSEENLQDVVSHYLIQTLNNIYLRYPKIFTKEEKLKWEQNIKIKTIEISKDKKEKIIKNTSKKKIIKKLHNTGINIPKIELDDDLRCEARVWGNGSCVKVNGKLIYGKRCNNKKKNNEKYCGIHCKNNTHGDFNQTLSLRNKLNYKFNSKCFKE